MHKTRAGLLRDRMTQILAHEAPRLELQAPLLLIFMHVQGSDPRKVNIEAYSMDGPMQRILRMPSSSMLAQVNLEHCRHKQFQYIVDH